MAGEELAFGDLDGDGLDEALVAAFGAAGGDGMGSVYVIAAPVGEVPLADALTVVRGDTRSMRLGTAIAGEDADGDFPWE